MKKSEWVRDNILAGEKQWSQGNLNPEILRKIPGRSGYFSKDWSRDVSATLWFLCMAFVLWCCKSLQQMPLHPPLLFITPAQDEVGSSSLWSPCMP